jgi:L-rhamnose isomerase
MKKLLADEGLGCVSIIPNLFSQKRWGLGSFSAKSAAIRQQALEETRSVCRIAREMTCPLINLWLGEIRALIAKGDSFHPMDATVAHGNFSCSGLEP